MPLAENGLEIAAEQIQHKHVAEQMPWSGVQEWRREELPRVGVPHAVVAEAKIFADGSGMGILQQELRDENSDIKPEESEECDALAFGPRPRIRGTLSAGQTHGPMVSQRPDYVFSNRPGRRRVRG